MKKTAIFILSLLLLTGCGKDKKDSTLYNSVFSAANPKGVLSCYSGKVSNSSSVISKYLAPKFIVPGFSIEGPSIESYLYIKSIEITTTGEQWIKIIDGPIEVKVRDGETIRISTSALVPSDQYEGVRLTIEPKIRFRTVRKWTTGSQDTNVDVTINKLPISMAASEKLFTPADKILFSSANGCLTPFNLETGKETFLVFEFNIEWSGSSITNITDWCLYLNVRGSRYLY